VADKPNEHGVGLFGNLTREDGRKLEADCFGLKEGMRHYVWFS
jgi:hypothetical protein